MKGKQNHQQKRVELSPLQHLGLAGAILLEHSLAQLTDSTGNHSQAEDRKARVRAVRAPAEAELKERERESEREKHDDDSELEVMMMLVVVLVVAVVAYPRSTVLEPHVGVRHVLLGCRVLLHR